jgi:hypothetical protein
LMEREQSKRFDAEAVALDAVRAASRDFERADWVGRTPRRAVEVAA